MDIVEKVRGIAPSVEVADHDLAAARARLLDGIRAEEPRRARRPETRRWVLASRIVAAAAIATAAAVVIAGVTAPQPAPVVEAVPPREPGGVFTPAPTPEPTAEPVTAASVLTGAASILGMNPGPVAGPGQYLEIQRHNSQLVLYSPEDPVNSTRAQATSAWIVTNSYTSYIPGDTSGEWVDVFAPELEVVQLFGADASARSEEWLAQFRWRTEGGPSIQRYQGSGDPNAGDAVPNQMFRHYPEMPRDPSALLEWIVAYGHGAEPGTEDATAVVVLMQELQLGLAPVDLRAAMFRALSLVPGIAISGSEGDVVTLTFAGSAPDERTDSISIDTRTALVTRLTTTLGSGGTVVPDSVPTYVTTQSVRVVDSAP